MTKSNNQLEAVGVRLCSELRSFSIFLRRLRINSCCLVPQQLQSQLVVAAVSRNVFHVNSPEKTVLELRVGYNQLLLQCLDSAGQTEDENLVMGDRLLTCGVLLVVLVVPGQSFVTNAIKLADLAEELRTKLVSLLRTFLHILSF